MPDNLKKAMGREINKELTLNNIKIKSSQLAANIEIRGGIKEPSSARVKPEAIMMGKKGTIIIFASTVTGVIILK